MDRKKAAYSDSARLSESVEFFCTNDSGSDRLLLCYGRSLGKTLCLSIGFSRGEIRPRTPMGASKIQSYP